MWTFFFLMVLYKQSKAMSQPMNFSPDIKVLEGGEIPPNSVTLVYSPSCPHCHNILPQYNQLANLSGGKFSVNAVNLMDHYHTLRAGGIEVGGVPQILIRGGGPEILEYGGPRMAESISKEALDFIGGGKLSGGRIFKTDALLGGSIDSALAEMETASISGGRRRRRLSGGRRRSRSRSRSRRRRSRSRSRRMGGGAELEGGRRRRLYGGQSPVVVVAAPETSNLSGGKKKNVWIRHVEAYWKSHPSMSYGEAMKAARSSYKSRSRG
jgi:thiol-disulfide isomerase/thioredoxin